MNQQLEEEVKKRTEELQESNDLLARQKELLQKTLDAIPQMIWVADATGKIKHFNDRWFTYTGLTQDVPEDQMITGFDVFHTSQMEEITAQITDCIRAIQPCHMEALVRNKQQEYRWHLHDILPVFNRHGAVELWVGSFTDITERKSTEFHLQELNESLAASNHELRSLNDELATFAFIASHDLREPLRKIQLFTLMLEQREENLSETGKDFFQRIMTSVQRMNELIDDILLYSQFTTGVSRFVNMNVAAALEEGVSSLRERIEQTSAEIVSSADVWMMADPIQVIQLLHNLVSNAIKFRRADVKPEVTITATLIAGKLIDYPIAVPGMRYVQIEVTDNGIGFEQHYEGKIFAMFQRLHSRAEYPGTGMGLAICRRIMENHKGFVKVKSEPGIGSVFTCYFPQSPGKRTVA
jgi:PAS domain S-box-containing protein